MPEYVRYHITVGRLRQCTTPANTSITTVFTKLASQLNADKLVELAVIPIIFIIQTLVSYLVAQGVSRLFGFHKRASNFVTAMGVSNP
jgi:predicted permease